MIENQKKSYGGEFLFVEANIDAVETAKHFGISANRAGDCLKSIIIGIFHRQVSQTSSDTAHIKIQIPPHKTSLG